MDISWDEKLSSNKLHVTDIDKSNLPKTKVEILPSCTGPWALDMSELTLMI